ncbi:hypothetical protein I6H96_02710 [Brucella anthropi]|uniref:Uncharacterized protein n=1 Tax=Brucella anthropi (strain ATCC 49188 / DSM 6882 / CCUG 24695 / JCM 21032 / LMG 3331 / NBRC 15819 / NCTC 12168 / Alc 37) TaxID=439375 RepID=A6WZ57_BRUA4|nr:hypothetical protein [Brucella anthropi]ABS14261.1 hypothetical protein Oant_1545 [Brucella anthropi ATCC 49188]NKC48148.1 hypothetical protein [Brucella anthropi ATCC 49188]QQC25792.1 hypothetical protein I6H96_02710 [Brucella anthropi]SUA65415.1 Uncharacterised protein [Brucella anthropi]
MTLEFIAPDAKLVAYQRITAIQNMADVLIQKGTSLDDQSEVLSALAAADFDPRLISALHEEATDAAKATISNTKTLPCSAEPGGGT